VDVFYSYDTCNSTAGDWLAVASEKVGDKVVLGGTLMRANIPRYKEPLMYKRDPNSGEILTERGNEYYNNSVPYEGVYLNYLNKIVEFSNGDVNITYTHASKASSRVYPESSFTAAVHDLENGLVDLSVGPFWVTGQRLKMAAFTLPLIYDKTLLVIPNPVTTESLNEQTRRVLAPFSNELWVLLLAVVILAALLSVWFSDRHARQRSNPTRRRKRVYLRLALDAFLQKGMFFFGAAVEQDVDANLPNKMLMFGFGFFILIAVSAYVANLAAFMTLSVSDTVETMEGAVAAGVKICAHPVLKNDLQAAWPAANFVYANNWPFLDSMLDDYDAKKCSFIAIGWEDNSMDMDFYDKLCSRNLVVTNSLVVEIPIAFPIRADLAAGVSYWINQAMRYHGISLQNAKDDYFEESGMVRCNIKIDKDIEADDLAQLSIKNMFFPLMFFLGCAVLAVILQLIRQCLLRKESKGGASRQTMMSTLIGQASKLDLVTASALNVVKKQDKKYMKKVDESDLEKEDDMDKLPQSRHLSSDPNQLG